jgi:hypothetical protein
MAALQGYIEEEASKRAEEIIKRRMDEEVARRMVDFDGMHNIEIQGFP